jgi:glycosyltransferase involved in cell wall biosynthesis
MPRTPSATIVIPAYNAAKTLERTLASAVASLRRYTADHPLDAEIVIIDDGSTDRTCEIAQAWTARDPAVRLIRTTSNRGAGPARNEAVRQSRGRYLFFLDADDVFYENHIGVCLERLLADDSIGYVFTRVKIDMPMHADWQASMDESCPINFCVHRVWHDMILGFPEEPDFRTYGTEDTLYRKCLRDLVKHAKLDVVTCEQFVSPGNALDRQRAKLALSMKDWKQSGIDDGFVMTAQMKEAAMERLLRVAKLKGEVS